LVEGNVFVCGRIKDVIIIRGRNFYPSDIEWAVSELPGIRRGNVTAFGVNVDGEEQLVICAEAFQNSGSRLRTEGGADVPLAGQASTETLPLDEAVASIVSAQFGVNVYRVVIIPQGALPRTSSGKPQRRKAKQMFEDGLLLRSKGVLDGPAPREGGSGFLGEVQV
jgi:fatty-acyl-CoA synthase